MTDSSLPPQEPVGGQPNQPYAASASSTPAAPLSAADDKLWASLSHFGGVLGPIPALLIFLILKDRGQLVRQESREALNFQITVTIGYVALWVLTIILALVFWPLVGILQLLTFALWVVAVVFSVLGGVKVQQGGSYRYPFALRLVK